MKIILSPAKKMNTKADELAYVGMPIYMEQTAEILSALRAMSLEELKSLWGCNEKIALLNFDRLQTMDLNKNLTPAILSYEGIAYQYMAASVMSKKELSYLQEHLRILSAFYGILRPMDGITPYRLEMQAKLSVGKHGSLYDFWGSRLCDALGGEVILNLASKEYAKCIQPYVGNSECFITITFLEKSGEKFSTKGTYVKMARGEAVRFLAEQGIEKPEDFKNFDRLGYRYSAEKSAASEYVFVCENRQSVFELRSV